jgi:hypothetical protein
VFVKKQNNWSNCSPIMNEGETTNDKKEKSCEKSFKENQQQHRVVEEDAMQEGLEIVTCCVFGG